jgi:hypothetical protein
LVSIVGKQKPHASAYVHELLGDHLSVLDTFKAYFDMCTCHARCCNLNHLIQQLFYCCLVCCVHAVVLPARSVVVSRVLFARPPSNLARNFHKRGCLTWSNTHRNDIRTRPYFDMGSCHASCSNLNHSIHHLSLLLTVVLCPFSVVSSALCRCLQGPIRQSLLWA